MTFKYVDLAEAERIEGLRMAVVRGVPSPWSESAKGLLHLKSLDWCAVSHVPGDRDLAAWTKHDNAPVLVTKAADRLSSWDGILHHVEDLVPNPPLLPKDPAERASMLGLGADILSEGGLCWSRRLQIVHMAMQFEGKPRQHAQYVGGKYGYDANRTETINARVVQLLNMLAERLSANGTNAYYAPTGLSAIDVYSAAAMALFAPLPDDVCAMDPAVRAGFAYLDSETRAALAPELLAHRDMMYERHLELPLVL